MDLTSATRDSGKAGRGPTLRLREFEQSQTESQHCPPNIYQIPLYHDHLQPRIQERITRLKSALISVNFVDIEYFRTIRLCGCNFFT